MNGRWVQRRFKQSYVYAGETAIPVQALEEGQRRQLAAWLEEKYLSILFQGQTEIQLEENLTNY